MIGESLVSKRDVYECMYEKKHPNETFSYIGNPKREIYVKPTTMFNDFTCPTFSVSFY